MRTGPADTRHDEYEYRYDENETETFVVDLDLTTLNEVEDVLLTQRGSTNTKYADTSGSNGAEQQDSSSNNNTKVQIVDLASENPLVLYRRQMYNCSWVDMIGTSMFFSPRPGSGGDDNSVALKTDVDFTLLGTSHIKLVGQQASLVPKLPRGLKRRRSQEFNMDDADAEADAEAEAEAAEAEAKEKDDDGDDDDDDDDDNEGDNDQDNEDADKGNEENHDKDKDEENNNDKDAVIVDGTALPGFSSTNWRTNIARRRQADFLDRLMQAKRSRGETDIVPTVGSGPGGNSTSQGQDVPAAAAAAAPAAAYRLDDEARAKLTPEQRVKLSNLSNRVVKGDARAVTALREMYSDLLLPLPLLQDRAAEEADNDNDNDDKHNDNNSNNTTMVAAETGIWESGARSED